MPPRVHCRQGLTVCLFLLGLAASGAAGEGVLQHGDFESDELGTAPRGWRFTSARSRTAAVVVERGARGSKRCLQARRTPGGRPTVLETRFAKPTNRLLLDLCFAFSEDSGEAFVIQTERRGGTRATQVRLAVQDGKLVHFDGDARAWTLITDQIEPTLDSTKPRWHRIEIRAERKTPEVEFWVSPPGSMVLPEKPTATLVAHKLGSLFHSVKLMCGTQSPEAFILLDEVVARDASDIPPPWIRRLLEVGRVKVEYYDLSKGRRGMGGLTKYWLRAHYKYDYRYKWRREGGERIVSVKPTLRTVTVWTDHRVYIPDSYDRPGRWNRGLMRHEFEHVAISTDPRLKMLIDHLCRKIGWVERTYDAEEGGAPRCTSRSVWRS